MSFQVLLGFDMESDIGSWTPYYEGLVHGTPRVLDTLTEHGATGTFFFVGDGARLHPEVVRSVADAGHEVGCHTLYHETIGDELFPIPGLKPVLPEECYHRIEVATGLVEAALGEKITSFRSPRLWGSTAVCNALEDLGYTADASYPMYFYKDRLVPYHPSSSDWTREGDLKLLEIPNFADMTMESHDEYGRDRDQWPMFRTEGAEAMMKHVENMIGYYAQRGLDPVFCFYMHPWEFWEMPKGIISYGEGAVLPDQSFVENCGEVAVQELSKLLSMLKAKGATFTTARDLVREYAR